jgi:Methyltransferase domain/Glycosyl transferase family 2
MKLGIPTLNQYASVNRLIESVERGSLVPESYIVIDNGGGYEPRAEWEMLRGRIEVVRPGQNIGVAASWNRLLDMAGAESIAISNDDVVFGPETFRTLFDAAKRFPFVGAVGGWALFAQSPECTKRVGYYDELFYPAYYEDCDYLLRMRRAGVEFHDIGWVGATHDGEATTKSATEEERALIADGRERNYSYFVTKWGTDSPRWGNPDVKNFKDPFNGKVPEGLSLRPPRDRPETLRTRVSPLRFDVLNLIAETIGARRYLEIGVFDGASMRNIRIDEKWGVDPKPFLSGVTASTVFIPKTSDVFFTEIAEHAGRFDLVFIDGDHQADQAYREVKAALSLLSPKGVVVLHDCSPHTEAMQEVPQRSGWYWTGDVWKAVARLRAEGEHVHVIPADFGIGIVLPRSRGLDVVKTELPCDWWRLRYEDLEADRERLLGLLRPGEWMEFIKHRVTCA